MAMKSRVALFQGTVSEPQVRRRGWARTPTTPMGPKGPGFAALCPKWGPKQSGLSLVWSIQRLDSGGNDIKSELWGWMISCGAGNSCFFGQGGLDYVTALKVTGSLRCEGMGVSELEESWFACKRKANLKTFMNA